MSIISDDVGSYPLPPGIDKTSLQDIGLRIVQKEASESEIEEFDKVASEIMQKKVDARIMRPNFPQIQDIISGFFTLVESFYEPEEPWVVQKEYAKIPEIYSIYDVAKRHYEKEGSPLELRVCVTGPLELYLGKVGAQVQGDLLQNLAKSVSRFVENSIIDKKYLKTKTICIDEPSLGLNPHINVDRGELITALETTTKTAHNVDTQIHLHSSMSVDLIYEVEGISIVGIESAENPGALNEISREDLESYDKFLRVGISRTNIYSLLADYRDTTGTDAGDNIVKPINEMESERIIEKRLKRAYGLFGDRITYAGPDCGLGAWPSQEGATQLLKNTAEAINSFNKQLK